MWSLPTVHEEEEEGDGMTDPKLELTREAEKLKKGKRPGDRTHKEVVFAGNEGSQASHTACSQTHELERTEVK